MDKRDSDGFFQYISIISIVSDSRPFNMINSSLNIAEYQICFLCVSADLALYAGIPGIVQLLNIHSHAFLWLFQVWLGGIWRGVLAS